jgi:hypothetical protein
VILVLRRKAPLPCTMPCLAKSHDWDKPPYLLRHKSSLAKLTNSANLPQALDWQGLRADSGIGDGDSERKNVQAVSVKRRRAIPGLKFKTDSVPWSPCLKNWLIKP